MHRSGTSSFAGLLARLGVAIGDDLVAADEWNPRGYSEHAGVVAIHDRFLAAHGLGWDSARAPRDFEGEPAREARAALGELLRRDFAGSPIFAVKDPRMCRLLPLWWPVLEELGAEAVPVLVLRHPLEVAASLERRDALDRARSHLLWLQHVAAAERETRGRRRTFLHYDEVTGDWRALARRVGAELGLAWPRDPEAAAAEIDAFLSGDLRHHRVAPRWPKGEAERFPWVPRLHALLEQLARQGDTAEPHDALDVVHRDVEAAAALFEPALTGEREALDEAQRRTKELEGSLRQSERRRQRLLASPWFWLRSYLNRLLGRDAR